MCYGWWLHPALENMQKHNKDEMFDHNKLLDLSQANNDPTIDNKIHDLTHNGHIPCRKP